MKPNNRILLIVSLALVTFFATSAFTATTPQDDKVVFGGSYVLADGETLTGNLVILGGVVTLEPGSTVNGDTALVGGNLDAGGNIQGSLIIIGGAARLAEKAVISQDVSMLGGSLTRATGSQINGDILNYGGAPFSLTIPGISAIPEIPIVPHYTSPMSFMWKTIYFLGLVVFTAALAMLIALLWGKATQRVANAIRSNPIGTSGFGCLTLIVAPVLLIVVAITIILSPLSLLGLLLLAASVVFGWVAINLEVGNRLARLFKVNWSEPIAAGIGALLFNLVIFFLALVPCLGGVLVSLVVLFAIGGVLLTRFGTHDYPEVPAVRPVAVVPVTPVAHGYPEVVKPVPPQVKSTPPAKKATSTSKTPAKPVASSKPKPKKPAGTTKAK